MGQTNPSVTIVNNFVSGVVKGVPIKKKSMDKNKPSPLKEFCVYEDGRIIKIVEIGGCLKSIFIRLKEHVQDWIYEKIDNYTRAKAF